MSYIHPAAIERERQRWLRPDWRRWVKPEAHHWDINRWYGTLNEEFRDPYTEKYMPPREYLQDKDWSERRQMGLRALIESGVLKP